MSSSGRLPAQIRHRLLLQQPLPRSGCLRAVLTSHSGEVPQSGLSLSRYLLLRTPTRGDQAPPPPLAFSASRSGVICPSLPPAASSPSARSTSPPHPPSLPLPPASARKPRSPLPTHVCFAHTPTTGEGKKRWRRREPRRRRPPPWSPPAGRTPRPLAELEASRVPSEVRI